MADGEVLGELEEGSKKLNSEKNMTWFNMSDAKTDLNLKSADPLTNSEMSLKSINII